jgi:propionate catabolism operon transcriptional regulator
MTVPFEHDAAMRHDSLEAVARSRPLRYAFVSNSAEVGETIRAFIDPRIERLTVSLASMEAAVPVARDLLAKGIEVVIGGGGTGSLLAQTIGQSVAKLDRDPLDVLLALLKARDISPDMGLTSFAKATDGVDAYQSLLGVRIRQIVFSSTLELSEGIEAAARGGCGVIVGGGICKQIAASFGLPGVVVIPRESNVMQTLKEARAIALARRKERKSLQELRTILGASRDGIIVLGVDGTVKFFNEAAAEILRPLLPGGVESLADSQLPATLVPTGLMQALETGEAEFDKVRRIGPVDIVVSTSPITVDGQVVGVVGAFREATRIQNLDRKVREKLYTKGFVAKYSFAHIRGEAPAMRALIAKARRFARSDAAIMIVGETGTGKELLAQSIHNESRRSEKPFLGVNCSALSDSLLESELFGYEEGAFTGARRGGKIGLFELANSGTLYLDEIADISPAVQMRLLRVIEEKEIMRLGGDRMVPVDVRIISSSQKDLAAAGGEREFRRDLYYRLATLKVEVPPLRERTSDIPLIVSALFEKHGANPGNVPAGVWDALRGYSWPGNIRELDSLVGTYLALREGTGFSEDLFLELFGQLRSGSEGRSRSLQLPRGPLKDQIRRVEREIVLRTLEESNFDRAEAAKRLGISLNSLWRKSRQGTG